MSFPDMVQGFGDWTEPIQFIRVGKTPVDHEISEDLSNVVPFDGQLDQQSARQVSLKPEGMRSWRWWNLATTKDLAMDDMIKNGNVMYRVWHKTDWSRAGYYHYEVYESYQGV